MTLRLGDGHLSPSHDVVAFVHGYLPGLSAGAEWMMHRMLQRLVADGMTCCVIHPPRGPQGKARRLYHVDNVDVLVEPDMSKLTSKARTARLIVTHLGMTKRATVLGQEESIPSVVVVHNTHTGTVNALRHNRFDLAVFNAEWTAAAIPVDAETIVVRPPVAAADYATTPGRMVTLVNHSPDKGGRLFDRIAHAMPDIDFLAVQGSHGQQVTMTAPNVTVQPMTTNIRDDVYGRTRILLAPSVYESWGRVGVEAMCSGIPVIAHPTEGLSESLGWAGTFVDRGNLDGWVEAIRELQDQQRWRERSGWAKQRAAELDPTADLDLWFQTVTERML